MKTKRILHQDVFIAIYSAKARRPRERERISYYNIYYKCIDVGMYIYIYIERERYREREIYTHTYIIDIYVYIHV